MKTRTDDAVKDILEIKKEPLISPEIEDDPSSQKIEVKSQALNKILPEILIEECAIDSNTN